MKNRIILIVIILLAFVLRVYQLNSIPVSVSWDEAAIGYNAYSILKTGKDEYGGSFPLFFKSFSDYKLPGYIYSVAISEKLFGLTPFAVRLPSALFGTATVVSIFFLVLELVKSSSDKEQQSNLIRSTPYIAAFFLAISPWHLQFSRAGFEANGQLFFITTGFYFLLRALRKPSSYIFAAFFFGLSFYFYYTTRVLTPLLGAVYILLFLRKKSIPFKEIIVSLVLFTVLVLPLAPEFFGKSGERASQVAIYNDESINFPYAQALARSPHSLIAKVIYNRRLAFFNTFLENYFRNNSFEYLFVSGDLYSRHDIKGMGVMYLWELPFVVLGIYTVVTWKEKKKWLLLAWWIIGGIPASLATGAPQALRTLSTLPVFVIFSAVGLIRFLIFLKSKGQRIFRSGSIVLGVMVIVFFVQYWNLYYDLSANYYGVEWGDGHKQLINYLSPIEKQYDNIYITGRYFKPYIYFLFYKQYDPATFHSEKGDDKHFGNYIFYSADWENRGKSLEDIDFAHFVPAGKVLYVFPSNFGKRTLRNVATISAISGKSVFEIQEPQTNLPLTNEQKLSL